MQTTSATKRVQFARIASVLGSWSQAWPRASVTELRDQGATPYMILISTILSLRTKDNVTDAASERLFKLAQTPQKMIRLRPEQIEKAIHPVGFFRTKTKTILEISKILIGEYQGKVPDDIDLLMKLKGVGRKTANLVLTLGYGKPGICVDTHVHRITNRWGYVQTKTPDQTEIELRKKMPKRYWIPINDWLVTFGQKICRPTSPICSQCPLFKYCERIGVKSSR